MTPSKFFAARVAQAFGIHRKTKRMSDAANEMHLLRDAEIYLGQAVWEEISEVEELSVEYWSLRKLVKEQSSLHDRLAACERVMHVAHTERANLLNSPSDSLQSIIDKRCATTVKLENLGQERDEIIARAREVRRSYEGLKMKLEVVGADSPEAPSSREKLESLKSKFTELKERRNRVASAIEEEDAELARLNAILGEHRQQRREQASEAFQSIGEANREISSHRAELGLIETQMRQLQAEIGRFVSRNSRHPNCASAARRQRGLIEIMQALRDSIAMNNRLAGLG